MNVYAWCVYESAYAVDLHTALVFPHNCVRDRASVLETERGHEEKRQNKESKRVGEGETLHACVSWR